MPMVVARMPSLQVEASVPFMMQFRFVSLAQFIEWCCKEKMTDLHVIIRASGESLQKTLRLISLATCVIISMMWRAV
jgi:hypothetical protein